MEKSQTITVNLGTRSYDIILKAGILAEADKILRDYCRGITSLLVTDTNVDPLYSERIEKINGKDSKLKKYIFPAGEKYKTVATLTAICRQAVGFGLSRQSLLLALGGGVCGDMAGFAAAIYMRGIKFIQIPTTLLAMVDSSVGGKTGVDLPEGKNLIGAFWQPQLVIIDPETLKTLPAEEIRNGLAEVVKCGMIRDRELFCLLEDNVEALPRLDMEFYTRVIRRCCELKAEIVALDEREGGVRTILNYGHTFGHAVELLSNFSIAHGAAVAIGMAVAAELGVICGRISRDYAERQKQLLQKLGLPATVPGGFRVEEIYAAMLRDKKASEAQVKLVLPSGEGTVSVDSNIDPALIARALEGCR
ncbi:MAG: 3-dehydroquinate synthase [Victivallales bacterium]|nr:3-dehydroquinate synthase [Victivallales bacterium]